MAAFAAAAGLAGAVTMAAEAGAAGLAAVTVTVATGRTLAVGAAAAVSGGTLAVVPAELLLEAAVALEVAATATTVSVTVRLASRVQLEVDQFAADAGSGQGAQLLRAEVCRQFNQEWSERMSMPPICEDEIPPSLAMAPTMEPGITR